MQTAIHPQYFDTKVTCACGNTFTVGSTVPAIHIELCNKCHPFYTGEQRFVDTASRIQNYQKKQETAKAYQEKKIAKKAKEHTSDQPKTLREMLMAIKDAK